MTPSLDPHISAVLITGATSGLGRKTALTLARRGRHVIVAGRRAGAVHELCHTIESTKGSGGATPFVADLADLESVEGALASLGPVRLRGIVTNAAVSTMRQVQSAQGYELTFAVNVMAHHMMLLNLSRYLEPGGRVVVVSSGVHEPENKLARRAGVPVPRWPGVRACALPQEAAPQDRLEDGRLRYSTSKLVNVWQARGMQRRLIKSKQRVDVFAIDPGLMVDTKLAREVPFPLLWAFKALGRLATPFVGNMRLSQASANHIASLIEDQEWEGQGFSYLDGGKQKPPSRDALDDEMLEGFWRSMAQLMKLPKEAGELV